MLLPEHSERRSFFETISGFHPRKFLKHIFRRRNIPISEKPVFEKSQIKQIEKDIGHKLVDSDLLDEGVHGGYLEVKQADEKATTSVPVK